jgi:hypothetical protein
LNRARCLARNLSAAFFWKAANVLLDGREPKYRSHVL